MRHRLWGPVSTVARLGTKACPMVLIYNFISCKIKGHFPLCLALRCQDSGPWSRHAASRVGLWLCLRFFTTAVLGHPAGAGVMCLQAPPLPTSSAACSLWRWRSNLAEWIPQRLPARLIQEGDTWSTRRMEDGEGPGVPFLIPLGIRLAGSFFQGISCQDPNKRGGMSTPLCN